MTEGNESHWYPSKCVRILTVSSISPLEEKKTVL